LKGRFLSALVIDDEEGYCDNLEKVLGEAGFRSHAAHSLAQARGLLRLNRYSLILCDNILHDADGRRGSEFIKEEGRSFGDADIVLVTGFPADQITDRVLLEDAGVIILKKAPGHFNTLRDIAKRSSVRRLEKIRSSLENFLLDLAREGVDSSLRNVRISYHLIDKAAERLKHYLNTLPGQDIGQVYMEGKLFSPRDLRYELDEGSGVGVKLIDMFIDDLLDGPGGE
jgi:DNA-binding NtrC family response regulator